jgi:GT2 family glycosyltransferase
MREMFWDQSKPIETNYLVWFDDDTWIVKPQWIDDLCTTIVGNHPYNFRMFGNIMYHDLAIYAKGGGRPDAWFRTAPWYKGRNFRAKSSQQETPNGSMIDFAVGWCWALSVEAMRTANMPDPRLGHNGGDITLGEQIHQAGFAIKQWNRGKSLVACPSREQGGRRGYSERFPWDPKR